MKCELAGKCYPSKQIIIFCAVWCSIGISEIYLGCEWRENLLPSGFTAGWGAAWHLQRTPLLVSAAIALTDQCAGNTNTCALSSFPGKDTNAHKWSIGSYSPTAPDYSLCNSCFNLTPKLHHHILQTALRLLLIYPFFRKPTLSGPNQIKNLLTPNAVKKCQGYETAYWNLIWCN